MMSVPPVLHPLFIVIPIPVPSKTPPNIAERRIFTGSVTSKNPVYPVRLPKKETQKDRSVEPINVLRLYLRPNTYGNKRKVYKESDETKIEAE